MKSIFLFALLSFAVTACDRDDGPPLEINDVTVFAPLPGTRVSVAYMSIRNNTQADMVIGSIRSPQFASVNMHETRIVDGISKMTKVETVRIPARSTLKLAEGGLHLMLTKPCRSMAPNQSVKLEFEYDADGLLIVSTMARSRRVHESDH